MDEEAIVDHGKSSFTTLTNYEREELESKFKVVQFLFWVAYTRFKREMLSLYVHYVIIVLLLINFHFFESNKNLNL